jgi:hypothetical protein
MVTTESDTVVVNFDSLPSQPVSDRLRPPSLPPDSSLSTGGEMDRRAHADVECRHLPAQRSSTDGGTRLGAADLEHGVELPPCTSTTSPTASTATKYPAQGFGVPASPNHGS